MKVTSHERPGVYSVYEASALISGTGGSKKVGLAASCEAGTPGTVYSLSSYSQAVELFGADTEMTELVRLLFLNGAAGVEAIPVHSELDYDQAFAALQDVDGISIVVCDSTSVAVQQALRDSVEAASEARRERIGVVPPGTGDLVEQLISKAADLNSHRIVLPAPGTADSGSAMSGARVAAAVAGAIAGENDPAVPLGGAELKGLSGLEKSFTDAEIDALIQGGVTPLESIAGVVSVVRGVTTRTTSGGAVDTTWRDLTTTLVVDDVIPSIRNSLRARFQRAKNTEQTRGSIRSQVVLELENKLAREIISGYDNVTVSAVEENSAVCLVEFSFTVAHGLNQIWLSAHITV